MVNALGIIYVRKQSATPWVCYLKPWNCRECERPFSEFYHAGHGLCTRCHAKWRYATKPEYRAKHNKLVRRWMSENPELTRKIQNRAVKAYYQRKKDAGICANCSDS